jgi:hypothetical protein
MVAREAELPPRGHATPSSLRICHVTTTRPGFASVRTPLSARSGTAPPVAVRGSGYEQAKAKLRCIEGDQVALALGPPA